MNVLTEGERRLAAIMFTDLVGYTGLTQRDEPRALELLDAHRNLVRPIVANHGGHEVKTMGDAFLLEFSSALAAVESAIEIQEAHHAHGGRTREGLPVRIGIHVGDVIHRGGDIYGDAVNIASRIEPLAQGGEVCISEQVYDQVRNKVQYPLVKLKSPGLKNVTFQVDVYRVELPWRKKEARSSRSSQVLLTRVFKNHPAEGIRKTSNIGEIILRLTMKRRIVDVEILNEPHIPAALARFSQMVDYGGGETLCIVSGIHTVRVVTDEKNVRNLTATLPKRNVLTVLSGLAEVIVTLSEAALRTKGVIATISGELARNGVNIFEYVHATPNVIIVVENKDARRTFRTLETLASTT